MILRSIIHVTALASLAATLPCLNAKLSVSLKPSISVGAGVGTMVKFTATASQTNPGRHWYRFRAGAFGEDLHIVKDYGPDTTLDWTATEHDGIYQVEVAVRDMNTGEVAVTSTWTYFRSNVTDGQAVVMPTSHPLVFMYSAPSCPAGATMKVQFTSSADGVVQSTPSKPCNPNYNSMNFYLAGMRGDTVYSAKHIVTNGTGSSESAAIAFTTGHPLYTPAAQTVLTNPSATPTRGILLEATILTPSLATDLNGNIIWSYPGKISFITRPEKGGYFFGVLEDPNADQSGQIVRKFDLAGMTVLETNAARVSEQLAAKGLHTISAFHHEARSLSNGNWLVLAGEERILTDVQGPGPVDVLGDMIIVLDSNLQVVWSWDAFDHLDTARMATLNDMCAPNSCPATYLAPTVNDWLHGNSVQETPDGNLLYSARSQDWVIKIDYQGGQGSGNVIWKMGAEGDFTINSSDPNPWFSHQHDPQFEPNSMTLTLFDNGDLRNSMDPAATSRGMALQVDEVNHVVTPMLNADLGSYSFALGAAQLLPNGDYHFDVGFMPDGTSVNMEVDPSGNTVYALHVGAPEYRSFRMVDMYTSPY